MLRNAFMHGNRGGLARGRRLTENVKYIMGENFLGCEAKEKWEDIQKTK